MRLKDLDSPEAFFKVIPKTLAENIEFRIKLHKLLAGDVGLQNVYKTLIAIDPKIAFNTAFWTLNPQKEEGKRNLPFILWPHQERAIDEIHKANKESYDIVVHKSRKEGATELITSYILLQWLLEGEFAALVGSEKADKVDRGVSLDSNYTMSGIGNCLFSKLCYRVKNLPLWMRPKVLKTYMHLENLEKGSTIDGESTNTNFGVSDRRKIILVDEIGVIEAKVAQSILANLPDVCDCNIYNSTHKWGPSHPYAKLLSSGNLQVCRLLWYDNPTKNYGLYETPDTGIVVFKDVDWWKSKYPWAFKNIQNGEPVRVNEWKEGLKSQYPSKCKDIDDIELYIDGGMKWGKIHAPWFDKEIKRRGGAKADIVQNIMGDALATNDSFFTLDTLQAIRASGLQKPRYIGDIRWRNGIDGRIDDRSCYFDTSLGTGKLRWWGKLKDGRPDQSKDYVLACDPSRGVGAANAVCGIFEVNSSTQVGMWVDPNTPEERFADEVWAVNCWVGGRDGSPYIIWEANAAGAFENRIVWQGARKVYFQHNERAAYGKTKTRKRGWWSTTQTKRDLLSELDVALGCGLEKNPKYKFLRIQDPETLDELESYIVSPSGDIIPSYSLTDSSGARKSHGDRVIVLSLIHI